jgi:hypothetical protein
VLLHTSPPLCEPIQKAQISTLLSADSDPFCQISHTQVTFETYQYVYTCSPRRLCIAYVFIVECATAAVATVLHVIVASNFNPASGSSWDLTYYVDQCDEDGRDPLMEHLAKTKPRLLVDCDERTSPALTHHEKPSRMSDPASPLAEEQSSARVTTTRSGANR